MVKAKRKQLTTLAKNKDDNPVESSIWKAKCGMHEDDDWVIIKKQKITILVSPLPSLQARLPITPRGPGTNKRQPKSKTTKTCQPKFRNEGDRQKQSRDNDELQKSDAFRTSALKTQINENDLASPLHAVKKFLLPASRRSALLTHSQDRSFQALNKNTRLMTATTTKFHQPVKCRSQQPSSLSVRPGACCLNVGVGLYKQDQKMRASNLERKLEKAGGLSRWLMSLGLGQFVQLFHTRNVNDKFQLLNLTMAKLKEMGAVAVGPRRKLMHAIDCLLFQQEGCTLRSKVVENQVLRDPRYAWDAAY